MTTNNDDYELIEVPVSRKIEVNLTLDDLLSAVAQQANAITSSTSTTQTPPPQVMDRLKQLGQLAHDIRGQLGGSA